MGDTSEWNDMLAVSNNVLSVVSITVVVGSVREGRHSERAVKQGARALDDFVVVDGAIST